MKAGLYLYRAITAENLCVGTIVAPSEYTAFHLLAKTVRNKNEYEAISRDIYPVKAFPYTWYEISNNRQAEPTSIFCRFKLVESDLAQGVISCD